jgi:hypothetical protein
MAEIINLTVLQVNQYALTEPTVQSVPVSVVASPVDTLVNGVQANSLVEVPPSGLNQLSQNLLVEETVSQIANLANGGTTTTTTAAPTTTTTTVAVLSFIGRVGGSSNDACNGSNVTLYTTGPLQSGLYPQSGIIVYSDPALTQPITSAYVSSPGIGQVWECFNGQLYNQQSCG